MLNRFLSWLAPKPRPSVWVGVERDIRKRHRRAIGLERENLARLESEIARLKRNKKRHSHLQQELDRLNA